MSERITVELSRDEWIALLIAARYGTNIIGEQFSTALVNTAGRLVDQTTQAVGIYSSHILYDEAKRLSSELEEDENEAGAWITLR